MIVAGVLFQCQRMWSGNAGNNFTIRNILGRTIVVVPVDSMVAAVKGVSTSCISMGSSRDKRRGSVLSKNIPGDHGTGTGTYSSFPACLAAQRVILGPLRTMLTKSAHCMRECHSNEPLQHLAL